MFMVMFSLYCEDLGGSVEAGLPTEDLPHGVDDLSGAQDLELRLRPVGGSHRVRDRRHQLA